MSNQLNKIIFYIDKTDNKNQLNIDKQIRQNRLQNVYNL